MSTNGQMHIKNLAESAAKFLTLQTAAPQNDQTHSNNSSAFADKLFENVNPSKHLNLSGLHLNHLGTPILTVNFLNVLNSLDSEP